MNLKERVVLITGASERIGRAIALKMASFGAVVVITYYKDEKEALNTVKMIKDYNTKGAAIKLDLNSFDEIKQVADKIVKEFGRWDILINCASVFETVAIENVDEFRWDTDHNIHTKGPFFLSKALYLHKKELGKTNDGLIVNITDTQVRKPKASRPSYNLAKAALESQVKVLAVSLAPLIRVNAVAPGAIIPSGVSEIEYFNTLKEKLPLKELPTVDNIVDTVLFLIKNDSITGTTVVVDSGEHLL